MQYFKEFSNLSINYLMVGINVYIVWVFSQNLPRTNNSFSHQKHLITIYSFLA